MHSATVYHIIYYQRQNIQNKRNEVNAIARNKLMMIQHYFSTNRRTVDSATHNIYGLLFVCHIQKDKKYLL